MVADTIAARDVLYRRVCAVLAPDVLAELYPQAVEAPRVFLGFPTTEPPFYAAVDEVVENLETSGAVSMGHATYEFDLHVWLCAQHVDLRAASDTLLAYIDAVTGGVMADQQLCMTVDNAFPRIEQVGTAADNSRRYIAAAALAITCTVYSACPAELQAVVRASNDEITGGGR